MNSPSFPSTVHTDHSPSFLLFIQIYKSQPFLSTIRTDLHITALPFYCSYRSTHHSPSFCSAFHTALHITSLPSVLLFIQLYTSQPFLTFCCLYRSIHHNCCCSCRSTHHSCSFLSAVHTDLHITAVPLCLSYRSTHHSCSFLSNSDTAILLTLIIKLDRSIPKTERKKNTKC